MWGEDSCEEIPGVRCDASGNVVELVISDKGMRGELPAGLAAALPELREVALDGNRLSGGILEMARDLLLLESFSASHNNLTGRVPCPRRGVGIPGQLACVPIGASALHTLSLSFNRLDGTIPGRCIAACNPHLAALQLESNRLTGQVPGHLSQLSKLVLFDVSQNDLTGTLPGELANLVKLTTLDLSLNRLSGMGLHASTSQLNLSRV